MSSLHLLMSLCLLVMTVSSNLPPPRNVRIISENFVHVLVWENNYLNASVHYITQERSQWKPVDKCSNVTNQLCDLTEYFTDLLGNYQGSVQSFTHNAISNISYSALFNPFESTALGPPIVRVTSCNKCVNLTINLPKSPTVSSDNNPILKLFNDYSIQYTIMVVTPNEVSVDPL
ncbi:interferon alpha beta receptor 2 isoform X1 [Pelobates cultripes]|uniref:Interferon alpha beta receptor 2 isoform X1 n=1 Tax=Pelobates cultripes TaxID=61616 RepID=A0AAD1QX83_PELCU|nr:interferon alpha beta receptor 2 isoform X1 [Pelobates cultripes]